MLIIGLNMVNRAFHYTCKKYCRQHDSEDVVIYVLCVYLLLIQILRLSFLQVSLCPQQGNT